MNLSKFTRFPATVFRQNDRFRLLRPHKGSPQWPRQRMCGTVLIGGALHSGEVRIWSATLPPSCKWDSIRYHFVRFIS